MFLVGGGIVAHGIPPLHHAIEHLAHGGGVFAPVIPVLLNGLCGLVSGAVVLLLITGIRKLRGKTAGTQPH
jgi:predicted DNA repair protein MutK